MSTTITISKTAGASFNGLEEFLLREGPYDPSKPRGAAVAQNAPYGQLSSELPVIGPMALLYTAPSLSSIPGEVTITSAKLLLSVVSTVSKPQAITVDMTRLLRVVSSPSWLWYSAPLESPWTLPGAFGLGSDRASVLSASAVVPKQIGPQLVDGYFALSGPQLIADIQAVVNGGPNYGWVVNRRDFAALDGQWMLLHGGGALPNTDWRSSGPGSVPPDHGTTIEYTGRRPILVVSYD